MRKIVAITMIFIILLPIVPAKAAVLPYIDVPADSWALKSIESAKAYGLIDGSGDGRFGYGQVMSRSEFLALICKMFGWELIKPVTPSFTDVPQSEWFYTYVETALAHDAVDNSGQLSPKNAITREEMAVALVRALGYKTVAEAAAGYSIPFTDVSTNKGYIALAYDIGMVKGTSVTTYAPTLTAKREEAVAMLVNVYERHMRKTEFLHGFYAFSSYDQRYVTDKMNTVSFGWSRMYLDGEKGVWLNTGNADGNLWTVPDSYEMITSYLDTNDTKAHLNVYMDTSVSYGVNSNSLKELVLNTENRTKAVDAIMNEVTRVYSAIGKSPYSGVTIDFEGLKGEEQKAGFNAFLSLLSERLKSSGLSLYVTVQPTLADGVYNDGYDYRYIGSIADKVILMAHDYNTTSLQGFVGTEYHKTTALTPITSVYHSLKAITDTRTGVEDKSKIVLAISFATIGWEITEDGKVKSAEPVRPAISTVNTRLAQSDTVTGWSETYKNAYMTYRAEDGRKIFLWYEDARSVTEKITLARLLGINGVSLWRIGTIPDYNTVYDVWSAID